VQGKAASATPLLSFLWLVRHLVFLFLSGDADSKVSSSGWSSPFHEAATDSGSSRLVAVGVSMVPSIYIFLLTADYLF
jgi:hypothetical protein